MHIYAHEQVFVVNKYYKWYYTIVEQALKQKRDRSKQYFESHHILPKSLFPQYSKCDWNLVLLTPREHFICHWLLIKMTNSHKMFKALHKMLQGHSEHRVYSSLQYEIARKYNSQYMIENNPSKRPEVKEKMSISAKNRRASIETRNKMSLNNGRYWLGKQSPRAGSKFYNNGVIQKMFYIDEVPEGWKRGRLNPPPNKGLKKK